MKTFKVIFLNTDSKLITVSIVCKTYAGAELLTFVRYGADIKEIILISKIL